MPELQEVARNRKGIKWPPSSRGTSRFKDEAGFAHGSTDIYPGARVLNYVMCSLLLLSPTPSLTGHWVGHIRANSARMLKKAHTPEHRKLLLYTIGRLEKSTLTLDLNTDGTFKWLFDDGFRPDRVEASGAWTRNSSALTLDFPGRTHYKKKATVSEGDRSITTSFENIDGLTAVFSKG